MNEGYIDRLSGVRGLAALVVLLSHVVQIHLLRFQGLGTPLHRISSVASEYAVIVFFILSGYLITHTLEGNIQRNGSLRMREYLAARIARLYPPFVLAMVLSIGIYWVLDAWALPGRSGVLGLPSDHYAARELIQLSRGEVLSAFFMVRGMLDINGPLWSLYIEAKLYVVFACALALSSGHHRPWLLVGVLALALWSGVHYNPGFTLYGAIWLCGALSYYLWNDIGRATGSRRILLCAGAIAAFTAVTANESVQTGGSPLVPAVPLLTTVAIAWLLFRIQPTWPRVQILANCSYSLYVTHFPILLLVQATVVHFESDSLPAAFAAILISVALAGGVALIGGRIERCKSTIQGQLLSAAAAISRRPTSRSKEGSS